MNFLAVQYETARHAYDRDTWPAQFCSCTQWC